VLEVSDIAVGYPGRPLAVHSASLIADRGELVAIIGTNGSGKSELIQAIAGLIPVTRGVVKLDGKRLERLPAHRIARAGIALVPEGRHIFVDLTVFDNLKVAVPRRLASELLPDVFAQFPILDERKSHRAGSLSGGEQQQLAIARALLMSPSVLLLDEPSAGLSPLLVKAVYEKLERLRTKIAVVVVEQVANLVLPRADRVYVMRAGGVVKEATPAELSDPEELQYLYFGDDPHAQAHPALEVMRVLDERGGTSVG
jgi:branched-chain amino acid transport system ATP-binding protein